MRQNCIRFFFVFFNYYYQGWCYRTTIKNMARTCRYRPPSGTPEVPHFIWCIRFCSAHLFPQRHCCTIQKFILFHHFFCIVSRVGFFLIEIRTLPPSLPPSVFSFAIKKNLPSPADYRTVHLPTSPLLCLGKKKIPLLLPYTKKSPLFFFIFSLLFFSPLPPPSIYTLPTPWKMVPTIVLSESW